MPLDCRTSIATGSQHAHRNNLHRLGVVDQALAIASDLARIVKTVRSRPVDVIELSREIVERLIHTAGRRGQHLFQPEDIDGLSIAADVMIANCLNDRGNTVRSSPGALGDVVVAALILAINVVRDDAKGAGVG